MWWFGGLGTVFILVLVTTLFWFRRKVCEGSNPVCRFLPLRAKLADLWSPVSLHLIFTKPTFLLHIFPPPTLLRHPSITTNPSHIWKRLPFYGGHILFKMYWEMYCCTMQCKLNQKKGLPKILIIIIRFINIFSATLAALKSNELKHNFNVASLSAPIYWGQDGDEDLI